MQWSCLCSHENTFTMFQCGNKIILIASDEVIARFETKPKNLTPIWFLDFENRGVKGAVNKIRIAEIHCESIDRACV